MPSNSIKNIKSPCINNCQLNNRKICIGCYRSIPEITSWSTASETKKAYIIESCAKRKNTDITTLPS